MAHFLLYTPAGSLVLTLAAIAVIALVVWWAVALPAALLAVLLWRLRQRPRYRPGAKS